MPVLPVQYGVVYQCNMASISDVMALVKLIINDNIDDNQQSIYGESSKLSTELIIKAEIDDNQQLIKHQNIQLEQLKSELIIKNEEIEYSSQSLDAESIDYLSIELVYKNDNVDENVKNENQLPTELIIKDKILEERENGLAEHTIKPYSCNICNKKFSQFQKYTFLEHKRSHKKEEQIEQHYSCNICERKFSDPKNLIEHKRFRHAIETNPEKPYSCDECNKKFFQKYGLLEHKRIHQKELYSCNVCNKVFSQKYGLIQHKRTHKNY
ncbi:zinc finger protein 271-like [Chrysoperla carnea]|uniref:zinc finger protein 271-like n=1 Tax=Chrysoperla carnea TaxID=189513 RepID=UPI001D075B12|nr:zinc finger protein 271-like [Chrysoperla carnea]